MRKVYLLDFLGSRVFWFVVIGIAISNGVIAQTPAQLYKAGVESLDKGDYYAAARYLKSSLDKDDDQIEVWFNYAEACRRFNDYANAAKGYKECVERDKDKQYTIALFWLGVMLQSDGDYATAKDHLNDFKIKYRKKDFYALKVQQLIEGCYWAINNGKVNDSIKIVHEGDDINTTFSEINPVLTGGDTFYFSSAKPLEGKNVNTRIYNSVTGQIFMPGMGDETGKHIANGCFSESAYGKEFFFTKCGLENGSSRCEIYVTTYHNNKWQPAKAVPVNVNLPGHTATHPNIIMDENGGQWLLFSANRPGGKGKMDIWMGKRLAAFEWDYPQNAGAIVNTPDDEVTPFYAAGEGSLYFSSLWHYGYGGFDIFKSKVSSISSAVFEKPKNLGLPLNSPANDLYYVTNDSVAYFSSNRKGSKFIEAETCCNDIYRVDNITIPTPEVVADGNEINANSIAPIKEVITEEKWHLPTRQLPPSERINNRTDNDITYRASGGKTLTSFQLPLRLYFHNDEPNPKTFTDTTALNYAEAYESYINRVAEYEREFTKGLNGTMAQQARTHILTWFTDTVERNFKMLVQFSSLLLSELQQGKRVSITVSGYCSPLNFNEYNIKLGNRRVASLLNFFYGYQNGVLLQYVNSGVLQLKQVSEGEETAAKNISDRLDDLRNSVYSPDAARERRVQILKVEVTN